MSTNRRSTARFITGMFIALAIVAPVSFSTHIRTAEAANILDKLTDPLVIKEYGLDTIAWEVKSRVLNSIVRSTVNWINNGFQGSPAFVTDLKSTLLDVADRRAEGFINQLTNNLSVNLPFQDRVARGVLAAYYLSTSRDGFQLRNPYTLDQYSPNPSGLISGHLIRNGGFQAWFQATLRPQNTPIGYQDLVESALYGGVSEDRAELTQDYINGQGVLSFRKCDQEGTSLANNSSTSGATVLGPDGKPQQVQLTTLNLNAKKTCLTSHVETPGSMILAAANKTSLSGIDQLISADELNEIVGALIGQLVNKVIGPTGFAGVSRPDAAGGRSFIDAATDPSQVRTASSGDLNSSFLYTLGETKLQLENYKQNWQKIQVAAEGARTALSTTTCVPDAQALITNQVTPVINEATDAFGVADAALSQLTTIISDLTVAQAGNLSAQAQAQSTADAQYSDVLKKVSPSDMDFVATQAADTGNDARASLYTQMKQLAAEAKCTN